jgi:hypothetical protein
LQMTLRKWDLNTLRQIPHRQTYASMLVTNVPGRSSEGAQKSEAQTRLVTAEDCTRYMAYELAERERRKKNMIIYNVEESSEEDSGKRREYDTGVIHNILEKLEVAEQVKAHDVVRLGPRKPGFTRPILVRTGDQSERDTVLRYAFKCSNIKFGAKQVGISPDRTPAERKEVRDRRDAAEDRKGNKQRTENEASGDTNNPTDTHK